MVVGLTGGIGSGKTTVLEMFKELGASVYVADIEAKKLMSTSIELKDKITELLGEEAYLDGLLNRAYIAKIVFKDPKILEALNSIVHPAVQNNFLEYSKTAKGPYVIYESALLFESKKNNLCDEIVLVIAPTEIRIQRVLKRDKTTIKQIEERISNQMSDASKIAKAKHIISNTSLIKTKEEVLRLHQLFLRN